ncbi:hypothetical protein [Duganella sp. Dugasp56]|uniref:hypothetical protein n=1 Tax=Duganella sp. Dugasp56 TaxID=3243046 RepID=UPI0039AF14AE
MHSLSTLTVPSPLPAPATSNDDGFDAHAVRAALAQVLTSELFCKCTRLSRLLRYLVEKRLAGAGNALSEYSIGIEVFDRSPRSYHTGEDPIVRVQVGRLREKLQALYARDDFQGDIIFTVPKGSYVPLIAQRDTPAFRPARGNLLTLEPFSCIPPDSGSAAFTRGLDEEVSYQLFQEYGDTITLQTAGAGSAVQAGLLLQGSVRFAGERLRLSARLLRVSDRRLLWSSQSDRVGVPSIALQEELAIALCRSLPAGLLNMRETAGPQK